MAPPTDADGSMEGPGSADRGGLPFDGQRRSGRLVAVATAPGPPMAAAIARLWERGDVPLPLPPSVPEGRRRDLVRVLRPAAVLDDQGEVTLPDAEPVDRDLALVALTSGSTGGPKAVALTAAGLAHAIRASARRLGCEPGERWLCCLPLHHVAGVSVLLRSALLGAPAAVHERFDVDAIAAERGVAHVSLVPTMLRRLLDASVDLDPYRSVLLGGAPPGQTLLQRAATTGVPVVESYGMTETCGGCVYDGRPLEGVEIALVDDPLAPEGAGRVTIAGPVVMRGYLRRPGLTDAVIRDGHLVTNDLGRWDADRRLVILGRTDDVIITGGENVVAGEVAALLRAHPAVADAEVIGRPDAEWGEIVVARCVPTDPEHPPTLADLRRFVADQAPAANAPRDLEVVHRLDGGPPDRTFVS